MEISLFLKSGSAYSFTQSDPEQIKLNLNRIDPKKFFLQDNIAIGSPDQSTGFRSSEILRLEIQMDPLPEWPTLSNIQSLRLLSEEEFRPKAREASAQEMTWKVGEDFVAYAEVEDCTGGCYYLEASGRVIPESVRTHRLSRVLEAPYLHARRGDSTAVLINPANLVRVVTYTRDKNLPFTALQFSPRNPD
ncbi:MAG: hypothetical protein ACYTG5_07905 [Planctomycetota bacterium]|jgi:hypothetical protein